MFTFFQVRQFILPTPLTHPLPPHLHVSYSDSGPCGWWSCGWRSCVWIHDGCVDDDPCLNDELMATQYSHLFPLLSIVMSTLPILSASHLSSSNQRKVILPCFSHSSLLCLSAVAGTLMELYHYHSSKFLCRSMAKILAYEITLLVDTPNSLYNPPDRETYPLMNNIWIFMLLCLQILLPSETISPSSISWLNLRNPLTSKAVFKPHFLCGDFPNSTSPTKSQSPAAPHPHYIWHLFILFI